MWRRIVTKTYRLRSNINAFRGKKLYLLLEPRLVDYGKRPSIPVRTTRAFEGRVEMPSEKKERLKLELENTRSPFVTHYPSY